MSRKFVYIKFIVIVVIMMWLALPAYAGIVFEDDFSNDAGWSATCMGTISQVNAPSRWTGYRCQPNSSLKIISGLGQRGTPALQIGYQITTSAGAMSLFKHLTGNQNTGYTELYIRYQFKFDDDWKSGTNGTDMAYWKWIRLWQGIDPYNQSQWSEINNPNTRYLIANFNTTAYGKGCIATTWADNKAGNSAGGPRFKAWYDRSNPSASDGCFGSMNGLSIQQSGQYAGYFVTYPSGSQTWHTIEYHFKLSTNNYPGNGVFEVWLDGVKQKLPMPYKAALGGASMAYLNTMKYSGGMNFLTVFDNMSGWSKAWSSTKHINIDNVVVSTSYIGTSYIVGGGTADTMPPAAPMNPR
jgi:hypothetical protein